MAFEIRDDRRYQASHEWAREDGDVVRVGISDFAQDELGDVVFVEFPEVGEAVTTGEAFGVVESIKAVSDLYPPVSGTVAARNEALFDRPELVNDDPYGEGWMLEIEATEEGELEDLLSAEAYEAQVE